MTFKLATGKDDLPKICRHDWKGYGDGMCSERKEGKLVYYAFNAFKCGKCGAEINLYKVTK